MSSQDPISDLQIIDLAAHADKRGNFIKLVSMGRAEPFIKGRDLEVYYSKSNKNVIRGMHLQTAPDDHEKRVHCVKGKCLDVVLDLRPYSPTFGVSNTFTLSESHAQILVIPRGCAHGFCALEDETCLLYITNSKYSQSSDSGVRWDSFGFKWPIENPIISQRDLGLLTLEEWLSKRTK